ncbi:MAG: FtsX-like permease family protein [Sarcina sp.]
MFYSNLALNNIKKSKQTYVPYGIISIFMVSILYIMVSISQNKEAIKISFTLRVLLIWGAILTGIFTVIFLFYINSFLMKKRKTEFGIYNVLGLNKLHIIKIVFLEKLILGLGTIVIGVVLGIIFEKLLFLVLLKLVKVKAVLGFYISYEVVFVIITFFLILNILMFLWDAVEIKKSKTIELLNSKKNGEKEPKVQILWTLIGILCLSMGYYISVTVENPMTAMSEFMGAVILVMIGTYTLFMSGSIAILKFLKNRKSIYYKTNNFISISVMIYRMKRNAVGLANICILSIAVIIAVSTTLSLYMGSEEYFNRAYKGDINITLNEANESQIKILNKLLENIDIEKNSLIETLEESNLINGSSFKDNLSYNISFNLNNKADISMTSENLKEELSKNNLKYILKEKEVDRRDFDALYGGFLFIGILIGIVFLAATILIIYYKQISEGHDDKERFEIMRKVGLNDEEIKGIIKKQVSTVFLSPVIVASIHLLFAYPAIEKMLYLLNLRNDVLFRVIMIGTVLVFLVVYILVYQITSRVYYKIVK